MSDEIHSMDYTEPKSGLKYRAKFYSDIDMESPDKEHDCHGVTYALQPSVEDILEDILEDDDLRMRLPLFRELYYERGTYTYYDVIGSINKLVTVWGVAPEIAAEEADRDYEYLRGWYQNEWHWIYITLTKLDEDGEETSDYRSIGGFESMLIDDEAQLSSVLADIAYEIEADIRRDTHKNQLELPLLLLT